MAKRVVSEGGFERIQEGLNVLKITEVIEDSNFNTLALTFQDKKGLKYTEKYFFEKNDGTPNTVALSIYTKFAGLVLGLKADQEFEDEDLLNKYFECEVYYEDGKPYISTKTGKEVTPKRLKTKDVKPAKGFTETTSSVDPFDDIAF